MTAVLNRADTVAEALSSVGSQSYTNLEHIVQDGKSTDGTVAAVQQARSPRIDFVSEPDGGIYDAINKGISRASGDVIGLMHSDDFFSNNRVVEWVAAAFQDPDVDGVYGDLDYVAADDTNKIIRHWRSGAYDRSQLRRGWMPPHPTLFLRREVFETWGPYDPSFQIAADYDAILRYLWTGNIRLAYVPEVLVKMRVGGESNRSLGRIVRKSREDYLAIRRNGVGGLGTLFLKNASKLEQFVLKRRK